MDKTNESPNPKLWRKHKEIDRYGMCEVFVLAKVEVTARVQYVAEPRRAASLSHQVPDAPTILARVRTRRLLTQGDTIVGDLLRANPSQLAPFRNIFGAVQ